MKNTISFRIVLMLGMLLGTMSSAFSVDRFFIDPVFIQVGESTSLAFNLDNTTEYFGFQADISLPEGLIVVKGSEGNPECFLSDRAHEYSFVGNLISENKLRVGAFSNKHIAISGNSGTLLYINVRATNSFVGGELSISNVMFTKSDNNDVALSDTTIEIQKYVSANSVALNKEDERLKVGETVSIIATVFPEDATDKTIVWSSSDESVATVTNEGLVTAVKVGEAIITAKATDGFDVSASCKVTVLPTPVISISIDRSAWSGKVGETVQLSATVQPEDATDKTIVWSSSDESVATVTNEGMVTAVKIGEAVITAKTTDGSDVSASCKVTVLPTPVTSISIDRSEWSGKVGETVQLSATVLPEDASDKSIVWSSSDESVVTVTNDGLITAIKVGEAVITAKSTDGSDVSATCNVIVIPTPVTSISFDKSEWSCKVGDTINLNATVLPEDATDKSLVWTSSDESVATVNNEGLVSAVKIGEATITAKSTDGSDVSASCKVTVIPTPVTSISIDKREWSGKVGETMQLTATVLPEDATDKTIVWTSSDESVATVDNAGFVTAFKVGEAVITAKSAYDQNVYSSCRVIVISTSVNSISIDKNQWTGKSGETIQLIATVLPEDATDKTIVWSSSDESIATVTNEGLVTAVKIGEAVITAKATDGSNVSASCKITVIPTPVTSISIDKREWSGKVGDTMQLTATILPEDATDKTIVWTSSDESVATVDNAGFVTAVKVGEAVITAKSAYDQNVYSSCSVIVISTSVNSISIDKNEWAGKSGDTIQLIATVLPEDATDKTIVWSSSHESVATVNNEGLVTAIKVGEAIITAKSTDGSDISASCKITVLPILVESITISPETWDGIEGESFQLNVIVMPEDATDNTVGYSSSDNSVAQVNQEGLVSVLTTGNCKIIVSTLDGSNITAECLITSTDGIDEIFTDEEASWNVYGFNGTLLKKNCDKEALKLLSPGVYILKSGNKSTKIIIH